MLKKVVKVLIFGAFLVALNTQCFAGALTDFQAAQAQVANLTVQVQQTAALAQKDPAQVQKLQLLQIQLVQAQQLMQTLQAPAVQELQQAQALQAQQAAALQAQQAAALQVQQAAAVQAQQAAAVQAQQAAAVQARQAAAVQAQQAAALQAQQSTANDPIVYIPATGDGTKYHQHGCRTIKHGEVAVKLSQAKAMGRTACGVCYK